MADIERLQNEYEQLMQFSENSPYITVVPQSDPADQYHVYYHVKKYYWY